MISPTHFTSAARRPVRDLLRRLVTLLMTALCSLSLPVSAVELPANAADFQRLINSPAESVNVYEPHLSRAGKHTRITYTGWPAPQALDALLGQAWRKPGVEVEFRALDGYVSRIPADRFAAHRAWLVAARADGKAFTVNNLEQNEKNVPLGPYYLVWDNIKSSSLLAEGGTYWPYQVAQILVSTARRDALLPGDLTGRFEIAASQTQKHCLSCHKINGYGGEKWPGDLRVQSLKLDEAAFIRWAVEPARVKPGTTMPGLPAALSRAERQAMAKRIYEYLKALPPT